MTHPFHPYDQNIKHLDKAFLAASMSIDPPRLDCKLQSCTFCTAFTPAMQQVLGKQTMSKQTGAEITANLPSTQRVLILDSQQHLFVHKLCMQIDMKANPDPQCNKLKCMYAA